MLAGCGGVEMAASSADSFERDAETLQAQTENYAYPLGENYMEINGIRLCYQDVGQGDETLLILPGLLTSIDFWRQNIPEWAKHYRVVAVDYPGIGKSDKPDASYATDWLVEQVVAFMDAMGIERATIIGGSLGGQMTLMMGLLHPERVNRLVVMGSSGITPYPSQETEWILTNWWTEGVGTIGLMAAWKIVTADFFATDCELGQELTERQLADRQQLSTFRAEGIAATRALKNTLYYTLVDRLGEITCPVLLIWGEYDYIHPVKAGRYMHEHLSDSTLIVVPGSGHEVMVDAPDAFNAIVLDFLADQPVHLPEGYVAGKTLAMKK
jgi:4,5:9,10-diseco-3-hydroxy-5,9,17-trioxoandrosta-1(10),2-diene-4-oate hydrolase